MGFTDALRPIKKLLSLGYLALAACANASRQAATTTSPKSCLTSVACDDHHADRVTVHALCRFRRAVCDRAVAAERLQPVHLLRRALRPELEQRPTRLLGAQDRLLEEQLDGDDLADLVQPPPISSATTSASAVVHGASARVFHTRVTCAARSSSSAPRTPTMVRFRAARAPCSSPRTYPR